jgi:hypothetical protein
MVSSQTFDLFEGDRPLLLVFAPSEEDDRFDGQFLCINDEKEAFLARDVAVYSVVGRGESTVGGEPLPRVDAESLEYDLTDRITGTVYARRAFSGLEAEFPLTHMGVSAEEVVVFPNGLATNEITITLRSHGQSRQVLRTRAGQVRITT